MISDTLQADYEKTYKKFENQPQPRITDVKYAIDIYPETRGMEMRGEETIVNKTAQALTEVHFTLADNYDTTIDLPGAKLAHKRRRAFCSKPTRSIRPCSRGSRGVMRFTVKARNRGFENRVTNREIVQNGTFFNSTVAPMIGYQPTNEMTDRNKRKEFRTQRKRSDAGARTELHRRLHGHLSQQQLRLGECGDRNQHFARPDRRRSRFAAARVEREWPPLLPVQARSLFAEFLFVHFGAL